MSDLHFGGSVRWLLALLLALPVGALLGQGAPWVVKPVHGYRIALTVESAFESAKPGTDPRHTRGLEHRLRVTVHEEGSGRAAPLASISADVAESGYSGTTIALVPVRPGEEGLFEGRVRLSTANAHRILIHATPAGGGRTLEAQFEYRHHH